MPDKAIKTSMLGTPIMSNITLIAPAYNSDEQREEGAFETESGGYIDRIDLDHVMVSVKQQKMIVKTQVEGMDGTIKEYVSLGDYEITIDGALVNMEDNASSPDEIESDLVRFLNYNDSIEVVGKAISAYGIRSVVVIDYVRSEKRGYINEVPFRIRLLSDTPEEIKFQEFSS